MIADMVDGHIPSLIRTAGGWLLTLTVIGSEAPQAGDPRLSAIAAQASAAGVVPAMGIAVVSSKGVRAIGVAGWRKAGDPTPVAVGDQWHIGSCTKMMTATVAARLVERGVLRWDVPVATLVAPGKPVAAAWSTVTLDQLLCHRGGLEANCAWRNLPTRMAAAERVLGVPPALPVGEFAYSNTGYVLAGALCERAAGKSWEDLIAAEVWMPLHMTSAGFGGMGMVGLVDQPWGHLADGTVAGNGPEADNPAVMGPAGRVHLSLPDWGLFIADQLRGARGQAGLLTVASYQHLQAPWPGGDYARGWVVVGGQPWARGSAYYHNGSNTMNYAVVWMAPAIDFAVLVTANRGDSDAACDQAAAAAIGAFASGK